MSRLNLAILSRIVREASEEMVMPQGVKPVAPSSREKDIPALLSRLRTALGSCSHCNNIDPESYNEIYAEVVSAFAHLKTGLERVTADCGCMDWCSCALLAAQGLLGELEAREGK